MSPRLGLAPRYYHRRQYVRAVMDGGMMPDNITATLPLKYTTNIAVDLRGFVRIDGVCIGRLLTEDDVLLFEIKDRNAARSLGRGAQLIRVPVRDMVRSLTE